MAIKSAILTLSNGAVIDLLKSGATFVSGLPGSITLTADGNTDVIQFFANSKTMSNRNFGYTNRARGWKIAWPANFPHEQLNLTFEQRYAGNRVDLKQNSVAVVVSAPKPSPTPTPTQNPGGGNIPAGLPTGQKKSVVDLTAFSATQAIRTDAGDVTWSNLLKQWNTLHGREWVSSTYRPDPAIKKSRFDTHRAWAKLGFSFTFVMASTSWAGVALPTAGQSRDAAKQMVDALDGLPCSIEKGNEPNGPFWPGNNPKQFVDLVGNPMYEVFHAAGIETITASVTYSTDFVRQMFAAGLQGDVCGFHPYRQSGSDLESLLTKLEGVIPEGMPYDLTEWNSFNGGNYRALTDPKNAKAEQPPMTAEQIIAKQTEQWAVLKKHSRCRRVSYFISHSPNWVHTTGPLELVDGSHNLTPFGVWWGALR